jgi:hypothetical protein
VLLGPGEVAEVLKKPSREELASLAMRMFSSVRKLPVGDVGDRDLEVAAGVRSLVFKGGGPLLPSEVAGFDNGAPMLAGPWNGPEPRIGVSLTIGEY